MEPLRTFQSQKQGRIGGSQGPSPLPVQSAGTRVGRPRSRSIVERDEIARGHAARNVSSDRMSAGVYRTPPSSWVASERPVAMEASEEKNKEKVGKRTEGAMPPLSVEKRTEGEFLGKGEPVGSTLEEAVGEELVQQLLEQNRLLQEQVKLLSSRASETTAGSWSAVGEEAGNGEGEPSPHHLHHRKAKDESSVVVGFHLGELLVARQYPLVHHQRMKRSRARCRSFLSGVKSHYTPVEVDYKYGKMGDLRYQVLENQVSQLQEALKEYAANSRLQSAYWRQPVLVNQDQEKGSNGWETTVGKWTELLSLAS